MMLRSGIAACCATIAVLGGHPAAGETRRALEYAPAPVDNPLKGLVPYQGDVRDRFPHSMEFNYVAYSALVKGEETFDWQPLEKMLNDMAGRGHQAIFRVYLEYPGRKGVIPDFLIRNGLNVTRWDYNGNPEQALETPDYANPHLRRSLVRFISALGARYDGDPRIGFITAGLLGIWGEWHNWPRSELFADKTVQQEVMNAYEAAFKVTPVLLRYPIGDSHPHPRLASNAERPFGYHDDSFAWATLETGRETDRWFFMDMMRAAGPAALSRWKTHPIGGEIRPEAWGRVFDEHPDDPRIQDFRQCVEATRVAWLMDSGIFRAHQPPERIRRAQDAARRMGYEFHAVAVTIGALKKEEMEIALEIENRGVAPFYYDWKPEWGALAAGEPVKIIAGSSSLTGLLPGDKPREWKMAFKVEGMPQGLYTLAVRIPNPMKGGKPIRFANATQDAVSGWLALGDIAIP